jgi:hypothetical protein
MQSFRLTLLSRIHYILFLLIGFLIFTLSSFFLLPQDIEKKTWLFIFLLFFLFAIVVVFWVSRKLSIQVVALTAHDDYLDIQWIKRPLFSSKEGRQILWKNMDSFVYERLRYDYQLKINLKNGSVVRFLDDGFKLEGSRQLQDFHYFMQKKSAELAVDSRNKPEQIPLREGMPFFRTKPGLFVSFFLAFVLIVGFILIPFIDKDDTTIWEWKFSAIFMSVFIVAGILFHSFLRKKNTAKTST